MKIFYVFPPNYEELKRYFPLDLPDYIPLFPYGEILYNPHKKEIPPDVMYHEKIHGKQQNNPDLWWKRYMIDIQFRLDQETEAYAGQYQFIKKTMGSKAAKEGLEELSDNLSSPLYKLYITKHQAETKIRKYFNNSYGKTNKKTTNK